MVADEVLAGCRWAGLQSDVLKSFKTLDYSRADWPAWRARAEPAFPRVRVTCDHVPSAIRKERVKNGAESVREESSFCLRFVWFPHESCPVISSSSSRELRAGGFSRNWRESEKGHER